MDDAGSPATALQDFKTLQGEGVVAIGDRSFSDAAFEKAADGASIPVISLGAAAASEVYETDPNFFTEGLTATGDLWAFAEATKLTGNTKLGVAYCAELALCQDVEATKIFATPMGISLAGAVSFSASSPNYTAQCLALKSAGVQVLQVAGTSISSNVRFLSDCAQQDFAPVAMIGGVNTGPAFVKYISQGIGISSTPSYFISNPATAPIHEAMDSYVNSTPTASADVVLGAWAGLDIIAAALNSVPASSQVTSADVYQGLYSFKDETFGGLTAPLTYTKGKPTKMLCAFFYQYKNKSYSAAYGQQAICQ
jgi:branched-chain amino acid transport system substrate-binding protein